jgi:hypothetical protein
MRRARWNQASAFGRSITSALRATNSVAGLPGTCRGHCTSPIWRVPAGGIETVMLAKAGVAPRSPENISAGAVRLRVVATSMSTWLAPGTESPTGTSTPRTFAQAPSGSARAKINGRHRVRGPTAPGASGNIIARPLPRNAEWTGSRRAGPVVGSSRVLVIPECTRSARGRRAP